MSSYDVVTLSDSNFDVGDIHTNPHARRWDASSINSRLNTRVKNAPKNVINFDAGGRSVQCDLNNFSCSMYDAPKHAPNGVERFGDDCECQWLKIVMVVCAILLGMMIARCIFKIMLHRMRDEFKFGSFSKTLEH